MRILLTTDTIGDVWTYSMELIRSLAAYDVHVALATMGRRLNADQTLELSLLPNVDVHESRYKLEWMPEPWRDIDQAGQWLLELEHSFQPDIVHLNGFAHGALPWRHPALVVGHSCVLSWWQAVKNRQIPAMWDAYRSRVQSGLQAADRVVAPSDAMLEELQINYGPLIQTTVIYHARDNSLFRPNAKEPFIMAAGRMWDEAKNLAALRMAAPQVNWPVYLAGEEERSEGLHPTDGCKRCLGWLTTPEMAQWLSRAAIYVHPARYEPFGLSVLEAAMCGCALVVGDIPSLREIWEDAAMYVSPDEPDELASVLKCLTADTALRQLMADRAMKRATRYTPAVMGRSYMNLYRQMLKEYESRQAEPSRVETVA